jgi:hypothetical protein
VLWPAHFDAFRRSSAIIERFRRDRRWKPPPILPYFRRVTTRWKAPSTAIAATAWTAICAYLYLAWPSLTALIEAVASPSTSVRWVVDFPRGAIPVLGGFAVLGLALKDRWLCAPLALAVDAVVGAPAFIAIAVLLHPFLVPVQ